MHTPQRRALIATLVTGLVASPLAVGLTTAAQADVATKIATFPYTQNWSDSGLITADNDWSGVAGVQGYRGDALTSATGVDPQTLLADGSATPTSVLADAPVTSNTGGLLEISGETIAMQGSGTADVPHLVLRFDLTGQSGASFAYTVKDLDASADDAIQQVALQYRVGSTGDYTNLPDGYVADATTATTATQTTSRTVSLPGAVDNQGDVFVRLVTTNAVGNDELIGIDDLSLTADGETAELSATDPGDKTYSADQAITSFQLQAAGGTAPYAWTATGLPAGLTLAADGTVSGTPTEPGSFEVVATATDSADPEGTASTTFTITVTDPDAVVAIAQIQGTGTSSPLVGQSVNTQGVVTAAFPTGGLNGFYIQTGGPDTPDASDGVFVYGGPDGFATYPAVGSTVDVTGVVSEFQGSTQVTAEDADVTPAATPQAAVVPQTVVPGADCALGSCPTTAELDVLREKHEGEAFKPTADYTATDVYDGSAFTGSGFSSSNFGEIGLAAHSATPLYNVTDVVDAQDTEGVAARTAYNNAHRLLLDDGSTLNYASAANTDEAFPYFTADHTVRVGAATTFTQPVVLAYGFGAWRFQPQTRVVGAPTGLVGFEQDREAAPAEVGGDVKLATFNVLNYFTTFGVDYRGPNGETCTPFNDREGNPVTTRTCANNAPGPRGAWDQANFDRQEAKIVNSINALDADVVTLEEIENSLAVDGTNRDEAVSALVDALNADAGGTEDRWAFAPSPAQLPESEDVIRTAFIYDPSVIDLVGASQIFDSAAFGNAREPLAQAFRPIGASASETFAVFANHFKSKGSGADDGTGQGNANPDRIAQATDLLTFVEQFQDAREIEKVYLAGDFNAYSMEDPVQVLEEGGFTALTSTTDPTERSYNFDGAVGSLDHVFANEAALPTVAGVDLWTTNAYESVYYEYSRNNYNVTNLYDDGPFRASDHNPKIVGIDVAGIGPSTISLLNINDFHGRIDANTTKFATTIERLRAEQGEDNTLFLSAGDNIGASLFASAVQDDDPTLDVLDALELRSSAVGNHEFDQGFADLQDDVKPDVDFSYLGANVYREGTTTPVLDEYDIFMVDGVRVAVVGAVTQETPSLVSPAGVEGLTFGDPVEAVNRVAAELTDGINTRTNGEADVIVAEYHEGAGASLGDEATCAEEAATSTAFGRIVNQTSAEVDAIFTGHTHKIYACDLPVPGVEGKTRPVLQTGSYGENIGQIVLTVDPATGEVSSYTQRNVARAAAEDLSFPRVQEVKRITDAALAEAARVGNTPVGRISADITRAFNGSADDRAAESTLGDVIANALRDGVSAFAEPDLGLTNPGGIRADLLFRGDPATNPANTDGVVTFAEANAVLPFGNTVALVELTGAQLKRVMEQQWQTNADGTVPSRPYLQLAFSDNVSVIADDSKPAGERIVSVRINGEQLDLERTYTVSTLSFLATGGDNFRAFTEGTFLDTGIQDAQLWRDYLATGTESAPIAPDFARQQVFVGDLGDSLPAGQTSTFRLGTAPGEPQPLTGTTLDLTSLGSPANTSVVATLVDGETETELGTFPVTAGLATVTLDLPADANGKLVRMVAQPSGTTVTVPVVGAAEVESTTVATARETTVEVNKNRTRFTVTVTAEGSTPTGTVNVRIYGDEFSGPLVDGVASIAVGPWTKVGPTTAIVTYSGDANTAPSSDTVRINVVKQTPTYVVSAPTAVRKGTKPTIDVSLTGVGAPVTGQVRFSYNGGTAVQTLVDGRTSRTLPGLVRSTRVTVSYLGSDGYTTATKTIIIRVVS